MKIWQKTIFWENIKRTLAVFSGPVVAGMHEFGAADGWMIAAGIISMISGVISIWMTDHDNDGIVDLFENTDKNEN